METTSLSRSLASCRRAYLSSFSDFWIFSGPFKSRGDDLQTAALVKAVMSSRYHFTSARRVHGERRGVLVRLYPLICLRAASFRGPLWTPLRRTPFRVGRGHLFALPPLCNILNLPSATVGLCISPFVIPLPFSLACPSVFFTCMQKNAFYSHRAQVDLFCLAEGSFNNTQSWSFFINHLLSADRVSSARKRRWHHREHLCSQFGLTCGQDPDHPRDRVLFPWSSRLTPLGTSSNTYLISHASTAHVCSATVATLAHSSSTQSRHLELL